MKLKLKEGILIQEVAGEKILMASGMEEVDYSWMIVLNPSAALLAEALIERSCTLQQLVEILTDVYRMKYRSQRMWRSGLSSCGNFVYWKRQIVDGRWIIYVCQ